MDVHCSSCNEPWDVYHLTQDVIFETGLTRREKESWRRLPRNQKLSDRYREIFRDARWEFGQSVINVIRCPCCPQDAKPNPEQVQIKAALEELLGEDEDGLAATFEDHHL